MDLSRYVDYYGLNCELITAVDHITADSANFETVLSLLSSFFVPEDEDVYVNWVAKVAENKKLRSEMQAWRAEWKELVACGKDGEALL